MSFALDLLFAHATTLVPISVVIDNNPRPLKIFLYLFILFRESPYNFSL
ncbi:Hypothetical protein MCYN_0743 [Mycoplasmopsis cynos C142]|uniref:Uncharacterized protein n=1 Tax=Mycoplasmopsis cynos (strain C142) TaxID=1246955 RepID=L0RY93_MYCC1|nr:Hypothetical protein MCYN_0743 [Mycoplasmopsis cynos C142]